MTSPPLRVRSFAKVNLALTILGKRPDGFHEIRTVLQTIDLCDELEFQPSSELRLRCQGIDSPAIEHNLVWKAAAAMVVMTPGSRGADIVLRKQIPQGAGLGGGSSNAAATLLGLCRLWNLEVEPKKLSQIAASLGSDVPYFLLGGTALGVGRGTEIYPLPELPSASMVVVYPGLPISTEKAYQSLSLGLTSDDKLHKIQGFCSQVGEGLGCLTQIFNDFETSIVPAHPSIREAKDFLQREGSTVTLLSGSGSSVFGFFIDEESALAASRGAIREGWRVFPAKTLSRAEYFQRMFG